MISTKLCSHPMSRNDGETWGTPIFYLRLCVRNCTSLGHSQHPLDCLKIHFADVRIIPTLLRVAEGGVEHASFAVGLCPCNGEVVIFSVYTRVVIVELVGIKAKQYVDLVA